MKIPDWEKARAYVLARLKSELPEDLYYHGIHHTRDDVLPAAERLAALASLKDQETLLLRTAALYHDVGFIEAYQQNEPNAARIATETLPQFGYHPEQIQTIVQMILATRLPQSPANLLQELLCDADLDSLGREDYPITSHNLWLEQRAHGILLTDREWILRQLEFLSQHKYFTSYAQALREAGKQKNIQELKKSLQSISR